MDDLRTVREAYGEPVPPTMAETTEARVRMFEAPRLRSGWRPTGWRLKVGAGVVAVGAAAAVAIAATGSSSPAPHTTVELGKGAVLAAAEKAELQPMGKYWHDDRISGQAYVVRAKTGTYAIFGAHSETFNWSGVKSGMGEAYYGRDLPAHPQTARDAALWRAAGSPARIRVWSGDHFATYTTKATAWTSDGPNVGVDPRGGGKFIIGKSVEDLQNLPTDPNELARLFLSGKAMEQEGKAARGADPSGSNSGRGALAAMKIMRVSGLLATPVQPKVRAGLIKALAAQPGVHEIGRVTDPLGRRGVALGADDRAMTETGEFGTPKAQQGTYRFRRVIVFDERTGALLSTQTVLTAPGGPYAEMKPGFVIEYMACRSAGWTDAKPNPPAKLPF
ncbi:hypothetical protein ACFOY4_22435 [Actinomadura syzygii]|uniref:CU044_5270 family protein n=1 Tax=Actinomadura syzygii TaxID=1427538 RepID=A0A5D0ULS6_9ACTN|nr:hypothetical protein [Actinomadura syzygii]TYC18776.1 hypothetical protein FXF65_03280 [Actinomadura syzygii]